MYVGIDVGGTNIRIAQSQSCDDIRLENIIALPNTEDYQTVETSIIEAITQMDTTIDGIGIGLPGNLRLAKEKTVITASTHLKHWHHKPLGQILSDTFDCPIEAAHDGVTAALGDALYGYPHSSFLRIGWGTGFNGSIVTLQGETVTITRIEGTDFTRYLTPWQRDCGGRAIEFAYGKKAELLSPAEWNQIMDLFEKHLSLIAEVYKPPMILFSGGVTSKQSKILKARLNELSKTSSNFQNIRMEIDRLEEAAGLYGAIGLFCHDKSILPK